MGEGGAAVHGEWLAPGHREDGCRCGRPADHRVDGRGAVGRGGNDARGLIGRQRAVGRRQRGACGTAGGCGRA